MRRVGQPEDIAQAVSFFVDDRSSFVNGQILSVSGGPNVWCSRAGLVGRVPSTGATDGATNAATDRRHG